MALSLATMRCCAVKEITSLSDYKSDKYWSPTKALRAFGRLAYGYPGAFPFNANFRFVIFTQAGFTGPQAGNGYGDKFAAFITKHQLGEVSMTGPSRNPNSGNMVKVWVWTVDHPRVKAFLTKEN